MKKCITCDMSKDLSEFNKKKSQKDGHDYTCRTCANDRLAKSGKKEDKTHESWRSMKSRCSSELTNGWEHYKGRGIKVCDRWSSKEGFKNFVADMGERPLMMTLDRIDVNGDYEPENCRWASNKDQARNRRNNHLITIDGVTACMSEWASKYKILPTLISKRLVAGWSEVDAVTTPARPKEFEYLYKGEMISLSKLSIITGSNIQTLNVRVRDQCMSIEDALAKPYTGNKAWLSNVIR